MQKTKIQWADASWNPITGCSKVSEGCRNCYAERMAKRLAGRFGYPKDDPFRVTYHPERLTEPLRWRKPRRIFVCSMGDLFHGNIERNLITDILLTMSLSPQHQYIVLTKRINRALAYFNNAQTREQIQERYNFIRPDIEGSEDRPRYLGDFVWPLPNLYLGVSVEDQKTADERIPILLEIPAAKHIVSIEPMLGPVDISPYFWTMPFALGKDGLCWVILGGETGPGTRPMHPDWVRSVRDQCKAAGVPFFMKQMAHKEPIPEDLIIREFPE